MRQVHVSASHCLKFRKQKKWLKKNNLLNHGPEGKRDRSAQRQTQGQEEGHDGPRRLRLAWRHLPADGEEDGVNAAEL